jgi:uncharacterized protein
VGKKARSIAKKKTSAQSVRRNTAKKAASRKRAPQKKAERAASRTTKKKATKRSVKRNDFITVKRGIKLAPPPTTKETAVPIRNLDGDVLAGVLHEPARWSNTLVILFHGFIASKDQSLIRQTAIELSRAGYAAYRVDFSGNGDSEGRFEDATPKKLLRDITATVEYFRKRYSRIALVGHSLGGMLSLIAASRVKVDGLVLIASPCRPELFDALLTEQQAKEVLSVGFTVITIKRAIGEIPYTITDRFVQEMRDLHPLDAAKDVHCPVLLIRGSQDKYTVGGRELSSAGDDEALMQALFSRDLVIIGGANHNFTDPRYLDDLVAKIIEWLRKQNR